MGESKIARIFMHGRSQAVRLPKEFRFSGDRVRVSRSGNSVVLEPVVTDAAQWFAELDKFSDLPFMERGRDQPPMPDDAPEF